MGLALVLLLLLLSPGLRGDSRWRVLLVPTRAFATAAFFWLALLPPGLAKAALPGNVTLWHYHLDHLGTTHSITDASGNLYRQTRTTAYGEVRGRYDGSGNVVAAEAELRHEFTGYQSEEKSGLQYAGARYYLPELGVFTSHDPARQFPSPYAYGPGDPINGTDPTGEDFGIGTILLVISIVAAVARFIHTGITTGKWGAAGIGLAINLAAIGIAYAVAQITAPYVNQFLNRLSDAWRTAYTFASRGYATYRTVQAARRGDYITAAETGLSFVAMAYADYVDFQSQGGFSGTGKSNARSNYQSHSPTTGTVEIDWEKGGEYTLQRAREVIEGSEAHVRGGIFVVLSASIENVLGFTVDLDFESTRIRASGRDGIQTIATSGAEISAEFFGEQIGFTFSREPYISGESRHAFYGAPYRLKVLTPNFRRLIFGGGVSSLGKAGKVSGKIGAGFSIGASADLAPLLRRGGD